jgi:Outer membrane protein beta-barrel domain
MKTIRLALYVAIAALFVAASPATVYAQEKSRSQGFFVGGSYEGNGVAIEDAESTESGSGFGVTFGYGFTRYFALYGQFSGASIESEDGDYSIGHFDIGTRVHFRAPVKTVVPFIQAGLSSRALHQDFDPDEVEASGYGLAVGGGINAHVNPAIAFTAGVAWSIGDVGDFKVNGTSVDTDSVGMTSARVHVGIIWFVQSK